MTSISVIFLTKTSLQILNLVDGVMVSMLASSAVDPQTIKLVFAARKIKEKELEIRIMCPSGATCLSTDRLNEQALYIIIISLKINLFSP